MADIPKIGINNPNLVNFGNIIKPLLSPHQGCTKLEPYQLFEDLPLWTTFRHVRTGPQQSLNEIRINSK